jgi:hypothetical protein
MYKLFHKMTRTYLIISNVVIIIIPIVIIPGMKSYHSQQIHIIWMILSMVLTIAIIGIAVAVLAKNQNYNIKLWIVAILHLFRIYTTRKAIIAWPRGNDGPLFIFQGIIDPLTNILAIISLLICVISLAMTAACRRSSPNA